MKEIELYKEFYFHEIARKHELNNSINTPIVIMAAVISLHVFIFSQKNLQWLLIFEIISCFSFAFVLYTIFYLGKSFSNLGRTHWYKELNTMDSFKLFKEKLDDEEKKKAETKFVNGLEQELAACSSHNFLINKDRTEELAKAKTGLIFSVYSSTIISTIYVISLIS